MNPSRPSHSLTGVLALLGVAITLCCWTAWGPARGAAAAVGSTVSVLNWVSMRWLIGRILAADASSRAGFSLLLVAKMGALMGVLYLLMQHFALDPLGLVLGLSVLFVGPVFGVLLVGTGAGDASTVGVAGEEQ